MTESEAAPLAVPEGRRASRRRTGAVLAAAALAPAGVLAAACGQAPGGEGAAGGAGNRTAAPVELAAWTWVSGADKQQQLQVLSDGVSRDAPNVSVKWAFQGPGDGASALEKLLIAMAGGTPPEVSMMQEAWIPQIGTESTLLVLDPYLKQSKQDLSDYIPAARAYMQFGDGKTRYLPWYFSPVALFYNTTHFAEAGIGAPPRSWEELVAVARKLVRADGDRVVRSGADLGANDWHWLPLLWGAGGEFAKDGKIVQNSPEGVETLQYLADLVTRHRVMGRPAPAGGFDGGNVGVSIFGSWNVKAKRQQPGLEFATALIPSRGGGPAPHPVRMEGTMALLPQGEERRHLDLPELPQPAGGGRGVRRRPRLPDPGAHLSAEGEGLLRADRGRAGAEGAGRGAGIPGRPADAPGAGLGADQGAGGQDAERGPGRAAQRPDDPGRLQPAVPGAGRPVAGSR